MSEIDKTPHTRTVSDLLVSMEDKIMLLIKTVAANDMNNKLILDRLNKILNNSSEKNKEPAPKINSQSNSIDISKDPLKSRKRVNLSFEEIENNTGSKVSINKVPVGQRVTDSRGKDLFMADVSISGVGVETINIKTNTVGKWQAYLAPGKYSIYISKIVDPNGSAKIEYTQDVEITPQMKSLQLPIVIVKR